MWAAKHCSMLFSSCQNRLFVFGIVVATMNNIERGEQSAKDLLEGHISSFRHLRNNLPFKNREYIFFMTDLKEL